MWGGGVAAERWVRGGGAVAGGRERMAKVLAAMRASAIEDPIVPACRERGKQGGVMA